MLRDCRGGRGQSRCGYASRKLAFESLEARQLLALLIDLGTHELAANALQQRVVIQVAGSEPTVDPLVTGFNLRAQVGADGDDAGPVFEAVEFDGGIWDAYTHTVTGGLVPDLPQFVQASVVFNQTGSRVSANGDVVTLLVSTVGVAPGAYDLRIAGTEIGSDSDFIATGGFIVPVEITNGTIVVAGSWQNPTNRFDVDGDGFVVPMDVLLVINQLNIRGSAKLAEPPLASDQPPPYLDINGDGLCTPLDVLQLVNRLNDQAATSQNSAEGMQELYPEAEFATASENGEAVPSNVATSGASSAENIFLADPTDKRQAAVINRTASEKPLAEKDLETLLSILAEPIARQGLFNGILP